MLNLRSKPMVDIGFPLNERPHTEPEKRLGPRWNRTVLWIATILSAFLWSLPYLVVVMIISVG